MSKIPARSRLGRGLNSLMSISEPEAPVDEQAPLTPLVHRALPTNQHGINADHVQTAVVGNFEIPVEQIKVNPHQPRRSFNETSLQELAASLKSTGLIQPIVVRKTATGYELIAGERRWRAARLAGMITLPAVVKEVDGYTQAQMALVENIQREDLNPIDRATAYRGLIDQLGLTQAELASRLGEDRTAIAHFLRLLDLAEPVRELIGSGQLSVGHGKLLASVSDIARQTILAQRVVSLGLSVRSLESLLTDLPLADSSSEVNATSIAHLKELEKSISRQLGMKTQVQWSPKRSKGKLIIHYTLDQFDDLKGRLGIRIED